jgi:hypothetical protein
MVRHRVRLCRSIAFVVLVALLSGCKTNRVQSASPVSIPVAPSLLRGIGSV